MSRPSIAQFVDTFFTNALFQPDDGLAQKALTLDLAEDAEIVINGNTLSASAFIGITSQFRSATSGSILSIQDLNIVPVDTTGRAGIVAQLTKYKTEEKGSGKKVKAIATTIVAVEERDGKQVIAGIWEAQNEDA